MDIFNKKWLLWTVMLVGVILITSPFWLLKIVKTSETSIVIFSDNKNRVAGIQWALEQERTVDAAGNSYYQSDVTTNFKLLEDDRYELVYISAIDSGLEAEQLHYFKKHLVYNGGKAVVEHSVFDLATAPTVRYELETLTNVSWTGWKGITYSQQTASELPQWLFELYEKRYGVEWLPSGAGVVFVNAFNDDVLVLQESDFHDKQSLISVLSKQGENTNVQLKNYNDWFTVFNAVNEQEVVSNFMLNINETGIQKLDKHQIPLQFPAIVNHQTAKYRLQTIAGEFSKLDTTSSTFDSALQRLLKKDLEKSEETKPYWQVFQPLFTQLVEQPFEQKNDKRALSYIEGSDYSYNTRSRQGEQFIEIYEDGQWVPFNVKGVNMGMGKPGYFPGEAAITESEYFRWFKQIGAMNANAIRVYTLQSPSFYKALHEYNLIALEPLYFFHGAWVVEEYIAEHENMFASEVTDPFHLEISHVIDAVYGNAVIDRVVGHAYGEYTIDVSDYLLGWIVGIEFSGDTVFETNQKNIGMPQYHGTYIETVDADPFEIWLAQSMEYTVNYEISNYKKAHLVSYTNWPTTDVISHPTELDEKEDKDKVDPNMIRTTDKFIPGQFYSFHIYPYYPDFIDESYSDYIDKNGNANAYAGYLNHLMQFLDLPSVITEFGIPASRGITHSGQLGRNQGGHSEDSQGYHVTSLFNDLINERYGGGLVFTWQDEWFKRTWNTMDFDNPDRRPYWSNYQTNEQYFGILSFESGQYESAIHVDGRLNDWEVLNSQPLYEASQNDSLQRLYVHHDARYLYLRLDYNDFDSEQIKTKVYFDTLSNQGNKSLQEINKQYEDGFEFMLDIKNKDEVELYIDSYYDTYYYIYGHRLKFLNTLEHATIKNNGVYHPIRLILSREYRGKTDDGQELYRPYEDVVTGKLLRGTSNPYDDEQFNSIADYFVDDEEGFIEVRLPWLMLNFTDPSLLEVVTDLYKVDDGVIKGQTTDGIRFAAISTTNNKVETLPIMNSDFIKKDQLKRYEWITWDHPLYHERLKKSYYDLQELFAAYK